MPYLKEKVLCFKKKPFGVVSFDQLELDDKGTLVDEDFCHHLQIPVKNYQYQHFTLAPGIISRSVGQVKVSCQVIQRGKLTDTIPFNATVIRHLTKIVGADVVSGKLLSKRLADFPAKPEKKKQRIQNWVRQHWDSPTKAPSTTASQTTYPQGTSSIRSCRCDWSNIATHPLASTKCCGHQGLCRDCSDRFDDIYDDIIKQEGQDGQEDIPLEDPCLLNSLQGSYKDDYGPDHYLNQSDDEQDDDIHPSEDEFDDDILSPSDDHQRDDSTCDDPEHFLSSHHCDSTENNQEANIRGAVDPLLQDACYDIYNDRLISRSFYDQALYFGYDLNTGSADQSNAHII